MKVFLTGATGFIGQALLARLVDAGDEVYCLVRAKSQAKLVIWGNRVKLIVGDITDPEFYLTCPTKIDCLFHVAALIPHGKYSEVDYFRVNTLGTRNVINYFLKSKAKRLIYVSSVAVYNPADAYSKSKLKAEKLIKQLDHRKKEFVIIRPTIAYGPGDTRPATLSLFRYIKRGLFFPVGRGENYLHTIYVDNLIEALVLTMTSRQAKNQDFDIGDKPCPKAKEVVGRIYRVLGRKIPKFYLPVFLAKHLAVLGDMIPTFPLTSQRLEFFTSDKIYNISKAEKLLGYQPKVTLATGLERTRRWYESQELI